MITSVRNFAFSLLGKKIFAALFVILGLIYVNSKPMNTAHSERCQKRGGLLTDLSPINYSTNA